MRAKAEGRDPGSTKNRKRPSHRGRPTRGRNGKGPVVVCAPGVTRVTKATQSSGRTLKHAHRSWKASTALMPCIGTMNPPVLVLVLEDKPPVEDEDEQDDEDETEVHGEAPRL